MAVVRGMFPQRVISRFGDAEWLPRSPDLSACDFFLWGYLKEKVYAHRPHTTHELKDCIPNYQDLIWGLTSILYSGYWVSCLKVKWPGRGVDHPHPLRRGYRKSRESRVIRPLASGPSWEDIRRTFTYASVAFIVLGIWRNFCNNSECSLATTNLRICNFFPVPLIGIAQFSSVRLPKV